MHVMHVLISTGISYSFSWNINATILSSDAVTLNWLIYIFNLIIVNETYTFHEFSLNIL